VFGSASFLEPFHDSSYFGFSGYGLHSLLHDNGFDSIEISPGINCLPLILWTLLSRMARGHAANLALCACGTALQLLNWTYPIIRNLYLKLTSSAASDVQDSYWFSHAPCDFAGHLTFKARRPAEQDR